MTTRENIYSKRMKNIPRIALGTSDANSIISCSTKSRIKVSRRAMHQGWKWAFKLIPKYRNKGYLVFNVYIYKENKAALPVEKVSLSWIFKRLMQGRRCPVSPWHVQCSLLNYEKRLMNNLCLTFVRKIKKLFQ